MKKKINFFIRNIIIITSIIIIGILIWGFMTKWKFIENFSENFSEKLDELHKKLSLKYGSFKTELPEQIMINKHIKPNSKILELGPNIGRSSVIANYNLEDSKQHLTVETLKSACKQLAENRDLNNMKFQIFNGAISNKPIFQHPNNWRTSYNKKEGFKKIPTITLQNLIDKYKIDFNTIIADCEGCLVDILEQNEWFLDQINLIILEHDFNKEKDLNKFYELMGKHKFRIIDQANKGEDGNPPINWPDGIKSDPIFVSVWKK